MFAEKIFLNCQCWNFDGININTVTTPMGPENISRSEYAPIYQTGGFDFRYQEAEINEKLGMLGWLLDSWGDSWGRQKCQMELF